MAFDAEKLTGLADFYRKTDGSDCGLGEVLRQARDEIDRLRVANAELEGGKNNGAWWNEKLLEQWMAANAKIEEINIAARGYIKASAPREDDDALIAEGGGYDLWLGRLLTALT